MARPKKDGLDYFPHDVDATTDPKLEPAIMMYGAAAYAFYFVHLEYCYRAADLSIDISATEIGAEMRAVIQQKLRISADDYERILQTLLRHGAFDEKTYRETGKLTSAGIHKRAEKVLEKREKAASRYLQNVSAAEMGAETRQSKAKTNNYSSCPKSADAASEERSLRGQKPFTADSEPYQAASFLADRIRERIPRKNIPERTVQSWAAEMDKLHRIDGQSWDDISAALDFSQQDPFWNANILSGNTFRKQYDKLFLRMQKENEK